MRSPNILATSLLGTSMSSIARAVLLWLSLFSLSAFAALHNSTDSKQPCGSSEADGVACREGPVIISTVFMEYSRTPLNQKDREDKNAWRLNEEEQEAMEALFSSTYNTLLQEQEQQLHDRYPVLSRAQSGARVHDARLIDPRTMRAGGHGQSQPLPSQYKYGQMLQWAVYYTCPEGSSDDCRLFSINSMASPSDFQRLWQQQDLQRRPHLQQHEPRRLQVGNIVEVSSFQCATETREYQTKVLVEVDVVEGEELNLLNDERLWASAFETTYNTLSFYTCDAPHFRTLVAVSVQEPNVRPEEQFDETSATDAALDSRTARSYFTSLFGGGRQRRKLEHNPPLRTLEFTITTQCRDCDGIDSIFSSLTETSFPNQWKPPAYSELQGPKVRQQQDTQCYCAASASINLDLSPMVLQQALGMTIQNLQEQGGFLTNIQSIQGVVEVQDQGCTQGMTPFEAYLRIDKAYAEPVLNANHTTESPQDLALQFQRIYNSLNFEMCDIYHRRIVNVTVDSEASTNGYLTLMLHGECYGCNSTTIRLFGDSNLTITENMTALLPAPDDTCLCPLTRTNLQQSSRAPTEQEVMVVWNNLFNSTNLSLSQMDTEIVSLHQIQGFQCQAPSDSQVMYTSVVVDFSGRPELIGENEAHLLEQAFAHTYNSYTFTRCDAKFRSLKNVQLFVIPPKIQPGLAFAVSSGFHRMLDLFNTTSDYNNMTNWNATDYNTTNGTDFNATAAPTLTDGVDRLNQTTTVFRVGVECRRCSSDGSQTFGLFDSFRRELEAMTQQRFDDFVTRDLTSTAIRTNHFNDTCFCPTGVTDQQDAAPTQYSFFNAFNQRMGELSDEGALKSVHSVQQAKEDSSFCYKNLVQRETEYSLDVTGLNLGQYSQDQFRFAFQVVTNSLRESDCSPYIKTIKSVRLTGGRRLLEQAHMLMDVFESDNATIAELISENSRRFIRLMEDALAEDRSTVTTVPSMLPTAQTTSTPSPVVPTIAPVSPTNAPVPLPLLPAPVTTSNPTDPPVSAPTSSTLNPPSEQPVLTSKPTISMPISTSIQSSETSTAVLTEAPALTAAPTGAPVVTAKPTEQPTSAPILAPSYTSTSAPTSNLTGSFTSSLTGRPTSSPIDSIAASSAVPAPLTLTPVTPAPVTPAPVTITPAPAMIDPPVVGTSAIVTPAPTLRPAPVTAPTQVVTLSPVLMPAPVVTSAPVTLAPVTLSPVTPAPVTPAPITRTPVTPSPTTLAPVAPPPVTVTPSPVAAPAPVTPAPVTLAPVTPAPVTPAPVTPAPVTPAPVTLAPVTPAPVTPAPVTPAPVTPAPVTPAPVTPAPVNPSPLVTPAPIVTPAPVTPAPVTLAPITTAPVTLAPVTLATITPAPITPVTPAPVTPAPVTPAPVTPAPVTLAPVTLSPVTPAPVAPPPTTPAPVTPAPVATPASYVNVSLTSNLDFQDLTYFVDSNSTITQYYNNGNTPDNLESGNGNGVTFAVVKASGVNNILVLYNGPGGSSGSMDVNVYYPTGATVTVFSGTWINGQVLLNWSAGTVRGFAVGHLNAGDEVCFRHGTISGLGMGVRYIDGTTSKTTLTGSSFGGVLICIAVP